MKAVLKGCALAGIVAMLSGCASLFTTFDSNSAGAYSGTRANAEILAAPFQDEHTASTMEVMRFLWPFALIDLPLSLAADTVLLPYAISKNSPTEKRESEAKSGASEP